jgi:hypothetical protein|tara:strand:+ start:1731 stop:2093 length:363 start_codon:yes stop_codon:yes gene_type:complete
MKKKDESRTKKAGAPKNIRTQLVSLSPDASDEEIERVAEDLGIPFSELRSVIRYGLALRQEAVERQLSTAQMMSAILNLLNELIMCYTPEQHPEICSDIYEHLLEGVGLLSGGPVSRVEH